MSRALPCPCGTGVPYDDCCGRFHRGAEPPDATSLMRSRYAAFVKRDAEYLVRTLHPSHDQLAGGREAAIASLRKHFAEGYVYRKLEVLDARGEGADGISKVLFVAHLARRGKDASFAEISSFANDGTGLRYLAGHTFPAREAPRGTTIDVLESR